jgi:hypothetical protein
MESVSSSSKPLIRGPITCPLDDFSIAHLLTYQTVWTFASKNRKFFDSLFVCSRFRLSPARHSGLR